MFGCESGISEVGQQEKQELKKRIKQFRLFFSQGHPRTHRGSGLATGVHFLLAQKAALTYLGMPHHLESDQNAHSRAAHLLGRIQW
jgi:hypothetical protein